MLRQAGMWNALAFAVQAPCLAWYYEHYRNHCVDHFRILHLPYDCNFQGQGVVVVGDENPDVGPYSKQSVNTYLGISTLAKTVAKHIQLGGISNFARIRISSIVLDKLRRFLP